VTVPDAFGLTRLFITPSSVPPDPTLAQNVAGGLLTQWDATSLSNTVTVGPVTYRNLSVCAPNGLTLGTVLLLKAPGGYIIMGNIGNSSNITFIDPIRYRSLRSDVSTPVSSTAMQDAGTLNFLLDENTQYAVDGCIFYAATSASDIKFAWTGPPNMTCKWSNWGTQDTSFTHLLFDTMTSYGDASSQETFGWTTSAVQHPKAWFATSDTGGLLQYRFGQNTSNATPAVLQAGSWMRIAELGPASGEQTFVKVYPATGSRSYNGSGSPISTPDGDNNLYTWSLSGRSNGNEAHMWTFDATTMRSDLAGATVLSAQMFLYCFAGSSIPADLTYRWSTTATIAGTFPNNGFGGDDIKNLWQVNSWNGFDISSQIANIINSNANSVLGGSYNFSDSASGFRGYGFSASYRPYLQLTYAV
jgi:hypothetical protein